MLLMLNYLPKDEKKIGDTNIHIEREKWAYLVWRMRQRHKYGLLCISVCVCVFIFLNIYWWHFCDFIYVLLHFVYTSTFIGTKISANIFTIHKNCIQNRRYYLRLFFDTYTCHLLCSIKYIDAWLMGLCIECYL